MRIVVLGVHEAESILFVERNRIQIGVNSEEATTGPIVIHIHPLDIVYDNRSNLLTFDCQVNTKATQFDRRITLQALFIRKALLLAETIEFRFVFEIRYGDLIIGKAAISQNLAGIAIYIGIANRKQVLLKSRSTMKDKII